VGCYDNDADACDSAGRDCPGTIYSDCTAVAAGCFIYSDSACNTPLCGDGSYFLDCSGPSAWLLVGGMADTKTICGSDFRLKDDIETIDGALDKILKLEPVEFDWKENTPEYDYFVEKDKLHSIGFIAQRVQEVYPELVERRANGYYTVHYQKINAILVEGIKEQQVFIEDLENTITKLETYFRI
jgi:hypothetical protein